MSILQRLNRLSCLDCSLLKSVWILSRTMASSKSSDPLELLRQMPNQREAARAIKQIRLKKEQQVRSSNLIPSVVSIGVIGNGAHGIPASAFVMTDHNSYLINCGEGTQRLAQEHRWRLAKCRDILITEPIWNRIGGLCGFGLTLESIGVPQLKLHGNNRSCTFLEYSAEFGASKELKIVSTQPDDDHFEDSSMRIDYVRLNPKQSDDSSPCTKRRKSDCDSSATVFCYVCTLHDKPGKLNIQKCMELKVPRGPMLAQLKAGHDITLEDGRIIKQEEVCDPNEKGERFLILDCPTIEYLDSLVCNETIASSLTDSSHNITCALHFTPAEVLQTKEYQNWIAQFGKEVQHLLLNDHNSPVGYLETLKLQYKLSLVDPILFPPLNIEDQALPIDIQNEQLQVNQQIVQVPNNYEFTIRPKNKKVTYIEPIKIDYSTYREELEKVPNIQEAIDEYVQSTAKITNESVPYPELITFGTGSAISGKYRTASCILVNLSESSSMLFDCGEGSLGQIRRFYGESQCREIIRNLKLIFISHLHADHQIGLLSVLKYRHQLQTEDTSLPRLTVYGPDVVYNFVQKMNQDFEPFLSSCDFVKTPRTGVQSVPSDLAQQFDLSEMQLAKVIHCRQSCGIAIRTRPNKAGVSYKIVYSGDAMPSETLAQIGQNADLLVHEATLDDVYYLDAIAKRHSTTSQAIDMGQQMNARFTLLTHFSQRYSKLPFISDDFNEQVGVAFDNMSLRLSDLAKMAPLVRFCKVLFADEFAELKKRNEHKLNQEQLFKKMLEQEQEQKKQEQCQNAV